MSVRQLFRVAIALVVALLIWGGTELFFGRSDEISQLRLIEAVPADGADTVEFAGPSDTVRLVRGESGAWTVNGFAASPDAIAELFEALAAPVAGELMARSAASHARMGVDTVGGTRLRIRRGGRTLADLIVGHQGRRYRTVYVRPAGRDEVYLLEGALATLAGRTVTDWRDKRIVTIEPDSVHEVRVVRGRSAYTLRRRDGGWWFGDGGPADSAAVRRLLDAFHPLTAQGAAFATPTEANSADFRRPERRVTLLGSNADTIAALLFDSTRTGGYWVRHADGGIVYRLFGWKVDDVTPSDSTLRSSDS